jgi:hypothetical protein
MLSKVGKLKKITAIVTICSFIMTIVTNAAWSSFPEGEEATIINFAQRLDALIPVYGDELISVDQLLDIYSKGELLKSELAAAAANLMLQENQSECNFIRLTALLCLLGGTQTVLALLGALLKLYIKIALTPPPADASPVSTIRSYLSTIRAYLRIAGRIITVLAVAPKAIANSILLQLQYWQCKREMSQ